MDWSVAFFNIFNLYVYSIANMDLGGKTILYRSRLASYIMHVATVPSLSL